MKSSSKASSCPTIHSTMTRLSTDLHPLSSLSSQSKGIFSSRPFDLCDARSAGHPKLICVYPEVEPRRRHFAGRLSSYCDQVRFFSTCSFKARYCTVLWTDLSLHTVQRTKFGQTPPFSSSTPKMQTEQRKVSHINCPMLPQSTTRLKKRNKVRLKTKTPTTRATRKKNDDLQNIGFGGHCVFVRMKEERAIKVFAWADGLDLHWIYNLF